MQFKHPEILWALLLLLIPILIHLFQLRRFKKTPFTNVAMLQKVISESRKSNTLKKWLLLLTRMLMLAFIVIAFAQPFVSTKTALQEKEIVIYLDDSFSMQAKSNGLSLLEKAVQDLVKHIDETAAFSLFTNTKTYKDITINDIKNDLLSLDYTHKQLNVDEVQLKAKTLFSESGNTIKNLILVSDFQDRMLHSGIGLDSTTHNYLVPVRSNELKNMSIDSIFLPETPADQIKLTVLLSGGYHKENLPISLYNGDTLIAKTSAGFNQDGKTEVVFSIPGNKEINGRVQIEDNGLKYDNRFFFTINKKQKIKVLAITDSSDDYLERLYTQEEFSFSKYTLNTLNYSALDNQNVVILNNLSAIPNSLQQLLRTFRENGGTLIIVPATTSNLVSYNQFLSSFFRTRFQDTVMLDKKITTISFDHPIYGNVFDKEVTNFQYPDLKEYFKVQSEAPKILTLAGGDAFLLGIDGFYIFSTSLEIENTNFKNSPLIVPTFYNMAAFSLQSSKPYHVLGTENTIDVPVKLGRDNILSVSKAEYVFIPLQQAFPNKVSLSFNENPSVDGIYGVSSKEGHLQNIS
ncbi:MAG: BatA domain-containing protein, partial [Flavobacteriaceae bacterium]